MKDYFGYEGKVCVVTGAASGMGKATAEMLVDLGAEVYALDWAEVKTEGIKKFVHVDLSSKESIDKAFEEIPATVDRFFGIAGVSGAKTDFVTTVKIDFIANKYICEEYMKDRMPEKGAIAFITSVAGNGWEKPDNKDIFAPIVHAGSYEEAVEKIFETSFQYLPGSLGYPFSKMAMNYYTIWLGKQFADKKIRVNAVLPGSTSTGLKDEFEKMAGGMDNLLSHCGNAGRLAESEEMAQPVVFLNSDMASYISGELTVVDFAQTSEEIAGLATAQQPISLQAIRAHMMQQAKK